VKQAKMQGIKTIAMTGIVPDAPLAQMCDLAIQIPSLSTPKIQEGHLIVGHTICGLVENVMFLKAK
jgi:D-sedoheptulose 7-phosphate isomerase